MWTERDQIQAYQFLRRRLVSALTAADANHPVSPSRRLVLGTLLGVGAAVLATAGFGVAGLVDPSGSADWHKTGQVIVEEGTGARFVLGGDGLLHPVLNYASARLLAGGDGDATVTVAAKALDSAPRGAMIGIAGAPDALPATAKLLPAGLTTCSTAAADRPAAAPVSTAILGDPRVGADRSLGGGGMLVQAANQEFLIAGGYRFAFADQAAVAALGYGDDAAVPVAATWLSTVPAARELALVPVPHAGAPGPTVGGAPTRVGQVLKVAHPLDSGDSYYLVRADGLEPVGATEATLVVAAPASGLGQSARVVTTTEAAVAGAHASSIAEGVGGAGYPAAIPPLAQYSGGTVTVCAIGDGENSADIVAGPDLPVAPGARPVPAGAATGLTADQVYVPPGGGALVYAEPAAGVKSGTVYLITDTGMKYPVDGADAVKALGYGGVTAHGLSTGLLGLLPTGPALDASAAGTVVAGTSG